MLPSPLVPLTRTVMRQRYRALPARSQALPRPNDDPHAEVRAPTGHRILIVGNEYAISWGVRTHALGLPGQLARELSLRTGLGAEVDVISDAGLSIDDVIAAIGDRDLSAYDAVAVVTGVGDAFTLLPPVQWVRHLVQLLDTVTKSTPSETRVTIVGIEPTSSVNICRTREDGLVDRWAQTLNEVTEAVCGGRDRVHYLAPPVNPVDSLDAVDKMRFKSPAVYKNWALTLARHLVPLLTEPLADQPQGTPAGPIDVRRRLAALDDLGILYTAPEARFTSIVRRARDLFGTEGAVFSLVTEHHQWNKAMVGFPHVEIPIEQSFCATTIRTAGPFIVEDAWSDPRITFDTAVRFYAGHPVTAPDGTRVGALCVFDANPRNAGTIDTGFLQELAETISEQLAREHDLPAVPAA